MIMGANELLAETLTLGEKSGIGAHTVNSLVKGICPTSVFEVESHPFLEIMPAPGCAPYLPFWGQ